MNVVFCEQRDFHVSFSGRDLSVNNWNRPPGSSMVDIGIPSNIMKSPSPKCYMTFWDMIIYSDNLHWSDISLNRELLPNWTLLPFWRNYLIPGGFHRTLEIGCGKSTEDAYSSGHLTLSNLGLAFVLMLRPKIHIRKCNIDRQHCVSWRTHEVQWLLWCQTFRTASKNKMENKGSQMVCNKIVTWYVIETQHS